MLELGITAIIELGKVIYSRLARARGLSAEFSKDIDEKVKYFVEISKATAKFRADLDVIVDGAPSHSLDGGEKTILKVADLLSSFTNAESSISHLRSMSFYADNRLSLHKLKKRNQQFLERFYEEFALLSSSAGRRCHQIDLGVVSVKKSLKHWQNFFSTGEAQKELIKTLSLFDELNADLNRFLVALRKMTEKAG